MSPAFIDNDGRLNWRKIGYHARSVFAVLLAAGVLFGGGWFVYSKAHDAYIEWRTEDDYLGEGTETVEVLIPRGAGSTRIGDILTEAGVIKSTKAFRTAVREEGAADQLKAGRFKLKKELPAATALAMLLNPDNVVAVTVTFPEGTTLAEQQQIISNRFSIPLDEVQAAADLTFDSLPSYATGLEGFLFPSTYQVAEPVVPAWIMGSQIRQFTRIADKLNLEEQAAAIGTTASNVVITASIIASEVPSEGKFADAQPMVAAVIYNRLNKGMKLEMDSTVHFAVGKSGKVTTTAEDRANPSPYNTYMHQGLPPGPISNPGETALAAALNPAATDALFFVTVNPDTGDTRFAATLEEHNANVALFQQWCSANPGKC